MHNERTDCTSFRYALIIQELLGYDKHRPPTRFSFLYYYFVFIIFSKYIYTYIYVCAYIYIYTYKLNRVVLFLKLSLIIIIIIITDSRLVHKYYVRFECTHDTRYLSMTMFRFRMIFFT